MRTTRALGALALGLALVLAGCSNDDDGDDTGAGGGDHNAADVTFASDMIQHHAQALAMVDLTLDRELDPQVQLLAEAIRDAQAPEIETMSDWLQDWDEDVPATVRDHANGDHTGDMGDMGDDTGTDLPGMMSDADLSALRDASDAEFQDLWLTMMIEHHEGAIEMAGTEQSDGSFQPGIDLAEQIESAQADEIATMEGLLGS